MDLQNNQKNKIEHQTKDLNLNIKLQLFYEKDPFIFIQNNLNSKRYRISTNFEYLNKQYNLKLQYIRDFDNLHPLYKKLKNELFEIIKHKDGNSSICFKNQDKFEELIFKIEADNGLNILKIYKYISGNKKLKNRSSLIIFNKIGYDLNNIESSSNYSLFFASENNTTLEDILQ
jgi:hypothetical protein